MQQLSQEDICRLLPPRPVDGHKGDFGRLLLLCGSRGYTGAPALAAMGALRTGAGLVYLGVPECIYAIEAVKLTEPVVLPLPAAGDTLSDGAVRAVLERLPGIDAVLLGPGWGQSAGTLAVLEAVLREYAGPVVLDADGINLLQRHKDLLRGRSAPTILTPHMGEFRRIGGDCQAPRADAAASLARELGAIILLKGHQTIITDGTRSYVNPTGNPGMAVGGSGDVLAGILVSLLGQGLAPLEAAAAAAWLHGAAGDSCARELGQHGMLPTDMLEALPRLLKQVACV